MHPVEAYKQRTGTGRLSNVALENSEIIVGVDFSDNRRVNEIINNKNIYPTILYPGDESVNISKDEIDLDLLKEKELYLFIVDSTWYYSKKILKLSKNLQTIPKLSFTTTTKSQFLFKKQPNGYCLSTIESIHTFLKECDRLNIENVGDKKETLLQVFNRMVNFQIECQNDPMIQERNSK
jgi:DTW domain-containing protein YfiP